MTGGEWWNASASSLARDGRTGRPLARGIAGASLTVIALAIVAVLWSHYSNGGLIRLLGGVTGEDLVAEAAKHPGPTGPRGEAGPIANASLVAQRPVDFDKSGPIPGSEAYLCALSKIALPHPPKAAEPSCELTAGAERGDPWQITVNGAVCGVMCFAVGTKK